MAYNQSKNPFSKNPLNFNSPLNSFDSLVGKLMNQGKSKEAATKIAGKVANAKMKGAGSGPTAAQKARMKQSPAKQAKPDFLDLDKDGNTTEPMKDAAKGSAAKMKSPIDKELVGNQKNLNEGLKKAIEAAPESPAKMKSPMKKHGDKFRKRAMKLSEKAEQGDYDYDNPKVVELLDKAREADKAHSKEAPDAKSSPASKKFDRKAEDIARRQRERLEKEAAEKKAKKKSPAKMKSPVKKLSAAEKRAKELARGDRKKEARMIDAAKKQSAAIKKRKSPAKMKSPMKKDGKKGDLLSRGLELLNKKSSNQKDGKKGNVAARTIRSVNKNIDKVIEKGKKFTKELKEGYKRGYNKFKEDQKRAT